MTRTAWLGLTCLVGAVALSAIVAGGTIVTLGWLFGRLADALPR